MGYSLANFETMFKNNHLGDYFEYLKPMFKNAIQIDLTKRDTFSISESRMGGEPDLPKSMDWFVNEETKNPMSFIAQINLEEINKYDSENKLPDRGVLYFFLDLSVSPFENQQISNSAFKVFYYEGEISELETKELPETISYSDDFYITSAKMNYRKVWSLPCAESDLVEYELLLECNGDYYQMMSTYYRNSVGLLGQFNNKLLGHADFVNPEEVLFIDVSHGMELECELARNGLTYEEFKSLDSTRKDIFKSNAKKWVLLFQIDSDRTCYMEWGDNGKLFFWIREEDLKNKNFDKVYCILQSE